MPQIRLFFTMKVAEAFKIADQLARSLGDYKHRFAIIYFHPDFDDQEKLEFLALKLNDAKKEIDQAKMLIYESGM